VGGWLLVVEKRSAFNVADARAVWDLHAHLRAHAYDPTQGLFTPLPPPQGAGPRQRGVGEVGLGGEACAASGAYDDTYLSNVRMMRRPPWLLVAQAEPRTTPTRAQATTRSTAEVLGDDPTVSFSFSGGGDTGGGGSVAAPSQSDYRAVASLRAGGLDLWQGHRLEQLALMDTNNNGGSGGGSGGSRVRAVGLPSVPSLASTAEESAQALTHHERSTATVPTIFGQSLLGSFPAVGPAFRAVAAATEATATAATAVEASRQVPKVGASFLARGGEAIAVSLPSSALVASAFVPAPPLPPPPLPPLELPARPSSSSPSLQASKAAEALSSSALPLGLSSSTSPAVTSQSQGSVSSGGPLLFPLTAPYVPSGDQPGAIADLCKGLDTGRRFQTLLGATGTGKTFIMANVIQHAAKPTLVLAPNKVLNVTSSTAFASLPTLPLQ
jgi:hypothetical protein